MSRSPSDSRWHDAISFLCQIAVRHLLRGTSFDELHKHVAHLVGGLLDAMDIPDNARPPQMVLGMATTVALELWNSTPIPENRFRPRKLPKPERNSPCPCGSGQKFKQCCGQVDSPSLGLSEELMLGYVLDTFPKKQLLELPLDELHPDALAATAHRWLEAGRPKDAIALLEKLFTHLPRLDGRAEWAADTLLNAYLDVHAPRKKQRFIDALKAAPDKTLRSAGWQRQATVFSDRGCFPKAWEAFREAQRLTPNAPALSHLEVLILISEDRREEAKARARFWTARLARDQHHDYSDLIATLNDLADDSDASLLRTLPLGDGPLPALAACMEAWPAPACRYSLTGGDELRSDRALALLESEWLDAHDSISEPQDLERLVDFVTRQPLCGQSFRILRDLADLLPMLPANLPGSSAALGRHLLERAESLRRTVLSKLKAQHQELPWGYLDNRPMLTLVAYYVEEFAANRPVESLELLRWSVNVANPNDNTGLRELLIHTLVAAGQAEEAIAVASRYPDDFASTEYGRALALFAAGRLTEAEAALGHAVSQYPKVLKMLHAANPRAPRMTGPGITVGGDDEAYEYRLNHQELWRSSGALAWSAGVQLAAKPRRKQPIPSDNSSGNLF